MTTTTAHLHHTTHSIHSSSPRLLRRSPPIDHRLRTSHLPQFLLDNDLHPSLDLLSLQDPPSSPNLNDTLISSCRPASPTTPARTAAHNDRRQKTVLDDLTGPVLAPLPLAPGEETLRALLRGEWLPGGAARCRTPGEKFSWLRSEIIGAGQEISTMFGKRRLVYADHTASGRPLRFIEQFMQCHVLPFYGNTHTEDSFVGGTTTRMSHMSEEYVKRQLGGSADDVLLFCGSGTTAAIKRLQEVMGIAVSPLLRRQVLQCLDSRDDIPRWVVFTGPYEHHSNLLSWRQSLAEVVEIPADGEGRLDMAALERALQDYSCRKPRARLLGAFSACSNVTGLLTDTAEVTELMHRYGGKVFFDFAARAAHGGVDLGEGGYDAVALSPHKLAGGPGTPGILLMRRSLYGLGGVAPSTAGGGTVSYVNGSSEDETVYYENMEVREDAGTPQILGKIRCALTFWVMQFVGTDSIRSLESSYIEQALARLSNHPNLEILRGHAAPPPDVQLASILSFIITPTDPNVGHIVEHRRKKPSHVEHRTKPLHGRFVVRLLNDMFGIQARGGCACAGPYGHVLLDIERETSLAIREYIMKGYEGLKPGWTRVSFCYDMTEAEVNYVLSSIEWVAHYGHLLLHLYDFDWKTGNWTCIRSIGDFKPMVNAFFNDDCRKDNNCGHMENRLCLQKPILLPNTRSHASIFKQSTTRKALEHTLTILKQSNMREIPNDIDSRVILFHC